MKKKLLTAALCLAVSFALSACGGNGADGTTAGKTDAATEGASQAAGSHGLRIFHPGPRVCI